MPKEGIFHFRLKINLQYDWNRQGLIGDLGSQGTDDGVTIRQEMADIYGKRELVKAIALKKTCQGLNIENCNKIPWGKYAFATCSIVTPLKGALQ